jgi:predicted ester cyclase
MNIKLEKISIVLMLTAITSFAYADLEKPENQKYHNDSGEIKMLKEQLEAIAKTKRIEQTNLTTFDDLDFNVFTNQKWDKLSKSHGKDIVVHWPDGHVTNGIDKHISDLKAMFVYAPDTRIQEHPIRIASGEWTAVAGTMEGTFTKPMPTADGKTIAPTGKSYKLAMVTIGHWTKEGVMDEEWLVWDNQTFMKQLGLGQ